MMLPNFILPAKSLLIFYEYFLYRLVLQHTCPSLQRRSSGFHSVLMSSGRHPVSSVVTAEQGTLAKWFRNSIPGLLSQKKNKALNSWLRFLCFLLPCDLELWMGCSDRPNDIHSHTGFHSLVSSLLCLFLFSRSSGWSPNLVA